MLQELYFLEEKKHTNIFKLTNDILVQKNIVLG